MAFLSDEIFTPGAGFTPALGKLAEYVPGKKAKPRKKRLFPAPQCSSRFYVRIDPHAVHMFRFFLETEENLGLMTVVDRWQAVLLLRFSPQQEQEARAFVQSMEKVLPLSVLNVPGGGVA